MIRLISLALAAFCLSQAASGDTKDVYTIKDIPVDERAESVLEAQRKAFTAARIIGAQRLIARITLPEDRQEAGYSLDNEIAQRMAAAVDVQEESRGGGRYRGTLATVINPRVVRPFLEDLGIPYLDQQASLALLIPVASSFDQFAWREAWGGRQSATLAPTITANANYSAGVTWEEIQNELTLTGASRGILAELRPGGGVRLTQVTAAGNTPLGTTRSADSFEDAVKYSLARMEDTWKRQAIVKDTTRRTITNANILYTSLPEWNRLRGSLARSPLVSEFQIRAISTDGAMVSFSFAGSEEQLEGDLRQRGVEVERIIGGWTMRSAISASR